MKLSLHFSFTSCWVGYQFEEDHQPLFLKRLAGFARDTEHLIQVKVSRIFVVGLTFFSVHLEWELPEQVCTHKELVDAYSQHHFQVIEDWWDVGDW